MSKPSEGAQNLGKTEAHPNRHHRLHSIRGARGASEDDLRALFAKPLILGASVSADWGAWSPGKRLALRYTAPTQIITLAQPGTAGSRTLQRLGACALQDRSLVLAIDLFFWDAVDADPRAALSALARLADNCEARGIPLVLGNIPNLLPGRQPSRQSLNHAIARRCRGAINGCYLLDLDELHRQVVRTGHISYAGKSYPLAELVPDGLHLSEVAADFLAAQIHALGLAPATSIRHAHVQTDESGL